MFTANSLDKVLSRSATCHATRIYQLIPNNHAPCHLWGKESLLNHQKVLKYYENDCLQKFILLFMSLLTALIVKNSLILAVIYFIFIKKHPRPNFKCFQYQIWTSVKRSGK